MYIYIYLYVCNIYRYIYVYAINWVYVLEPTEPVPTHTPSWCHAPWSLHLRINIPLDKNGKKLRSGWFQHIGL